jgi:hypothetical protein
LAQDQPGKPTGDAARQGPGQQDQPPDDAASGQTQARQEKPGDDASSAGPGQRRPPLRRPPDRLRHGDVAPDFTLKTLDGKSEVTLGSFRGQQPVALIFGSYT